MMKTVFNRRPSEDQPDAYELFFEYFNQAPAFVFKGGGMNEDDYDETTMQKRDVVKATAKLTSFVDETIGRIRAIYKSDDITAEKRIWINTSNNSLFAALIFAKQNLILELILSGTKKAKNIFLFASEDTPEIIEFTNYIATLTPKRKPKKDTIRIISQEEGSFYMTSVDLEKKQHIFDLVNYNDDFGPVAERVIKDLSQEDENGLVLLHGGVGTGKTTFLKYLLRAVTSKQIVYVPPDLAPNLSSPSFVTFLIKEATNSILLIEDAENILKHREAGGNQAVSNILNISDGILGDVLKIQIVCTFNTDIDHIDPALRRPGRLIAEYEFKKLTADKAAVLMKKVHGDDVVFDKKAMNLAEIYNFKNMPEKSNPERERFVGFVPLQG